MALKRSHEEKDLIGYIHNVSTMKTSSKGNKYFVGMFQTSKNETLRLVGFAGEKHSLLTSASVMDSPVKLKDTKLSPTKDGNTEVLIYHKTELEVVKKQLDFKKAKLTEDESPGCSSPFRPLEELTVESIHATIEVKIVRFVTNSTVDIETRYGMRKMKQAIIADNTYSMKMAFWGTFCEQVQARNSYQITNIVTKTFNGQITINTTSGTVIKTIPDLEKINDDVSEVLGETSKDIKIDLVRVSQNLKCSNTSCGKTITLPNSTDITVRCQKCSMKQKIHDLKKVTTTFVTASFDDGQKKTFTIFQDTIKEFLHKQNKATLLEDPDRLEDHFLLITKFTVTYNADSDVITKLQQ